MTNHVSITHLPDMSINPFETGDCPGTGDIKPTLRSKATLGLVIADHPTAMGTAVVVNKTSPTDIEEARTSPLGLG